MEQLLIIDDDDLIRRALSSLLGQEYQVHAFSNGEEALSFLRAGARPFAILVDGSMSAMSGLEFRAEQLRDPALAHIPAILMSGDDLPCDVSSLGFPAALSKPFSASEILPLLHRFDARSA